MICIHANVKQKVPLYEQFWKPIENSKKEVKSMP